MRRAVIEAQRGELLHWRDVGRLPDESLRDLERELDHEEGCSPRGVGGRAVRVPESAFRSGGRSA